MSWDQHDLLQRYTYRKIKAMMGQDGPRFVEWTRARLVEQRKSQLYDELDDEDEDDIILARKDASKTRTSARKGKRELWTARCQILHMWSMEPF